MLKNYLKITFRNFLKHKGYSFINVFGLAVGIACCLLILLFVVDELSYDKYHEKADRIYRAGLFGFIGGNEFNGVVTASPMARMIALRAARSVSGFTARCIVAFAANSVSRGSMITTDLPRRIALSTSSASTG